MARRRCTPLIVGDDSGGTSAEYAILASLIAGVIVIGVAAVGVQTLALFTFTWPAP
jgi:Flp pilus assembly pilin Flp